jgi:hypothetical protein
LNNTISKFKLKAVQSTLDSEIKIYIFLLRNSDSCHNLITKTEQGKYQKASNGGATVNA